jgi:hypothetical protein
VRRGEEDGQHRASDGRSADSFVREFNWFETRGLSGPRSARRFKGSSDLQQWTRIRAMNLPQWRVSVLDCASPLALSMIHDLQSGSGLPYSKTWRLYERFMESGMFLSDLPTAHEPDCDGGVAATRFMGRQDGFAHSVPFCGHWQGKLDAGGGNEWGVHRAS